MHNHQQRRLRQSVTHPRSSPQPHADSSISRPTPNPAFAHASVGFLTDRISMSSVIVASCGAIDETETLISQAAAFARTSRTCCPFVVKVCGCFSSGDNAPAGSRCTQCPRTQHPQARSPCASRPRACLAVTGCEARASGEDPFYAAWLEFSHHAAAHLRRRARARAAASGRQRP